MCFPQRGIGPTEEKVRALVEAREPEPGAEVRSFLGLVNFRSRFILVLSHLRLDFICPYC